MLSPRDSSTNSTSQTPQMSGSPVGALPPTGSLTSSPSPVAASSNPGSQSVTDASSNQDSPSSTLVTSSSSSSQSSDSSTSVASSSSSSQSSDSSTSVTSSSSSSQISDSSLSATSFSNMASQSSLSKTSSVVTASTSASPKSIERNSDISPGETAGIAIGCAIVGALIAAVVVWLTMKRRMDKLRGRIAGSVVLSDYKKKAPPAPYDKGSKSALPILGASPTESRPGSEDLLPQPIDTNKIAREMSTLRTLLKAHCDNFYFNGSIEHESLQRKIDVRSLSDAAGGSISTSVLVGSLVNVRTRADAILFVLSAIIFKRLDATYISATLLPAGMAYCLRVMEAPHGPSSSDPEAFDRLLSRWRVITGYLQTERYINRAFAATDDRSQAIQVTIKTIDSVIGTLAIQETNSLRYDNLIEIIRRAARFGNELISQPSAWKFDWTAPRPQNLLVLFPCLVQVTDDGGRKIAQGVVLEQKLFSSNIRV